MSESTAFGFEIKSVTEANDQGHGEISGYGAVFGNRDLVGDVILPGAFSATIGHYKTQNARLPMHLQHKAYGGGNDVPIGVWDEMAEDDHGLFVKGRILNVKTDPIAQRIHALAKERAFGGLSIGYVIPKNGAVQKGSTREIKAIDLLEVSLVDHPANALAIIEEVKAAKAVSTPVEMATSIKGLVSLLGTLKGSNSPNAEQRAAITNHVALLHRQITGEDLPDANSKSYDAVAEELAEIKSLFKQLLDETRKASRPQNRNLGPAFS